eukprot:8831485-Ditylum_brightwellii.AAC.1
MEDGDKVAQSKERKRKSRWGHVSDKTQNIDLGTAAGDKEKEEGVIISIDGWQHPVGVLYVSEPVPDYVIATVGTALQIHIDKFDVTGDILCFLPSEDGVCLLYTSDAADELD